jgi:predicted DNA-binding transcriptional regulator AlpA
MKIKKAPKKGTHVVWPAGVEERYGIKPVTRWRWEKAGRLPPRDISIGGRTGWRPETLDAAETPLHPRQET